MVLEKVASAGTILKVVVPTICSGVVFWKFYKGERRGSGSGVVGCL